jgi:predicted amino acid-binding ACT domain protein
MASTLGLEGIEAIMFRTIGDQPALRETLLPTEVLRLPQELARVDALLDDLAFFAPYFHPLIGRPSTPVECYLRLMFLKFRYRLGYENLCAEAGDSISWRRFRRIPLDSKVPHPTLMKLTARCGSAAVAGLNEALQEVWAEIFDTSQSVISGIITKFTPLIEASTEEDRPTAEEAKEAAAREQTVLVDGFLAPTWSWRDTPELWPGKHKTTGFNGQAIADLRGDLLFVSEPLPGITMT